MVEDVDRQCSLRSRGESGHDHLVERERKREQPAGDERSRKQGPDDEAEGLPAVGAKIHRRLEQRGRAPSQPREHVVVDDHDAERRVPHDDRPDRESDGGEVEGRVQRHAGDDPRQRDREEQQERDRLAAEEAKAVDRGGGRSPEHERDRGRRQADLERKPERAARLRIVPGLVEPVEGEPGDRPTLDRRTVEGVGHDQQQGEPEKRNHRHRRDAQADACAPRFH